MSKKYGYKLLVRLLVISALASAYSSVWAAGFQLQEQNVTNLGTAYAGTASLAEDASTGFYNAAGLSRLCEEQIAVAGVYLAPRFRTNVTSATSTFSDTNIGQGSTVSSGGALIPGVHYFRRLNDCLTFGLNLVSPFGLKTNYNTNSIVRYTSTRAELRTFDISPSLAYSFGNGFSIGAGPDFVWVQTRLDSALGVGNPTTDGYFVNTLSRWAFGGHVGVLWEISDCTRIGANYRSQLKVRAQGTNDEAFLPLVPPLNQTVLSTFTLPDTAVISAHHQLTECWAVMADVQWTHWKIFNLVKLDLGSNNTISTALNFKDAWRFALGSSYQFDDCWLFRIGAAYDQSPVRNAYRTVQVPDSDRWWAAIGGRYCLNSICKGLAIDFGYAHVFFKNATISQGPPTGTGGLAGFAQSVNGRTRTRADLFGIQLTWDLV